MLVGVPKEIKDNEYRVGLVPSTVRELTDKGHRVLVETGAGSGAGLPDTDYKAAGAEIVADADAVYGHAELVVKVKEPLAVERKKLRRGQVLFAYLHLAPDRDADRRPAAVGCHRDRLRNGYRRARHAAVAYTDVGSRRAHGAAMSARAAWKRKTAAVACSSPASRVCRRRVWSFSAAALPEPTRL